MSDTRNIVCYKCHMLIESIPMSYEYDSKIGVHAKKYERVCPYCGADAAGMSYTKDGEIISESGFRDRERVWGRISSKV